jgi:hypothetical protein
MKHKAFLIAIMISAAAVTSCSKKNNDSTPSTPSPATTGFTCKVNGTGWTADSATWTKSTTQTFILAYKGGNAEFEINLAGVTATTYNVSAGTNDFIYWPTTTSFSGGSNGSIVISTYDNTANQLTGTFGTISTNGPGGSFTISEGVFTKLPKR